MSETAAQKANRRSNRQSSALARRDLTLKGMKNGVDADQSVLLESTRDRVGIPKMHTADPSLNAS